MVFLWCGIVFAGEKVLWGEVLFLNNTREGSKGRVRRERSISDSI
jgi:hypothetical protein